MWVLRIPVKPPLFQRFLPIALIDGGWFALVWIVATHWMETSGALSSFRSPWAWAFYLFAGAFFGLPMAFRTRRTARRLGLPPWERYPADRISQVFT